MVFEDLLVEPQRKANTWSWNHNRTDYQTNLWDVFLSPNWVSNDWGDIFRPSSLDEILLSKEELALRSQIAKSYKLNKTIFLQNLSNNFQAELASAFKRVLHRNKFIHRACRETFIHPKYINQIRKILGGTPITTEIEKSTFFQEIETIIDRKKIDKNDFPIEQLLSTFFDIANKDKYRFFSAEQLITALSLYLWFSAENLQWEYNYQRGKLWKDKISSLVSWCSREFISKNMDFSIPDAQHIFYACVDLKAELIQQGITGIWSKRIISANRELSTISQKSRRNILSTEQFLGICSAIYGLNKTDLIELKSTQEFKFREEKLNNLSIPNNENYAPLTHDMETKRKYEDFMYYLCGIREEILIKKKQQLSQKPWSDEEPNDWRYTPLQYLEIMF